MNLTPHAPDMPPDMPLERPARPLRWLAAAALLVAAWAGAPALAQGTPGAPAAPASGGGAGAAPRFAVFSEMARHITVVQVRSAIGSRIDSNQAERVPIPDGTLDRMALTLVRQAVHRARPTIPVVLIAPLETDLYPGFESPFVGTRVPLADDLAQALREKGTTHLLLVTAQRGEAAFQFAHTTIGSGTIGGLGFYVDHETPVKDLKSLQTRAGYLAPYAYFRLSMIEVASGKLLASKAVRKHHIISVAGAETPTVGAWTAMTAQQKVSALRLLMEEGVDEAVKELLAAV